MPGIQTNLKLSLGLTACLSVFDVCLATAADSIQFAPHRAVYEISLANTAPGSSVAGVTGRMVYELGGSACEGYTQNMRFVTRMANQEGVETVNDLRSSSWEEAAGKRLRFSSSQYANDQIALASQGDAKRETDKEAPNVDLTKPQKSKLTLPADVYFPMQHATSLLTAAKNAQTVFVANLYDGGESGDKFYATTSIIGKRSEPGAVKMPASIKDANRLDALQSWPVAISYFDPEKKKQDALPAYELSFRYFENGVTSELKIDYGDFAIKGELKELTFNDKGQSDCVETKGPPPALKF